MAHHQEQEQVDQTADHCRTDRQRCAWTDEWRYPSLALQ